MHHKHGEDEGTAKTLVWSLLPCVCLPVLCVSEEFLAGAALALWLGKSLLQE